MQFNRGVDNGILMNSQNPLNTYQAQRATVGGRQWGNWESKIIYNPFIGTIFAIRVYSRQLSDREILINQKIDNARFGLGLNIPDEVLPANRSLSILEPFEFPDESESEQELTSETSDER